MSIAAWQKSMQTLRDFARKENTGRCEMCAQEIREDHQHLFDPASRHVICGCDGCSLLFDSGGRTKYRRIPRDTKLLENFQLPDTQWERLQIPISLGFVYRSSVASVVVAAYPSPFGLVEATVDEEPWRVIVSANAELVELREDVEALLVNRLRGQQDYFIAPIDRCFELAGIVRRHWQGMSGGDRVWAEVGHYLAALRKRART